MNLSRKFRRNVLLTSLLGICLLGTGCGADDNEKEFLNSAPPGKASEFPDEKVSERRQRTKGTEVVKKKKGKAAAPTPKS